MSRADYAFVTRWAFDHDRESLWEALDGLLGSDDPVPWWPSVSARHAEDESLHLTVRSAFGYRLRFRLFDLMAVRPQQMTFCADGDLEGHGALTFVEGDHASSTLVIAWEVRAVRPWMQRTSMVLRPVFLRAHHLVMREGHRRLSAWLTAPQ